MPVAVPVIVEIDVHPLVIPAFVSPAKNAASESVEQSVIDMVPADIFVGRIFGVGFSEIPRCELDELAEFRRDLAQVPFHGLGDGFDVDVTHPTIWHREPLPESPFAPARIAGETTDGDIFCP